MGMRREDEDSWRIEDVRREIRPFGKPKVAGLHYAVLRGHEVVETFDISEWSQSFESTDRIVEQTTVNRYWISTVFVGLYSTFGNSRPRWFETMVFEEREGKSVKSSRFERHYSTWEEAKAGHDSIVEIIRYGNF
jgi:hypothetical protein